MSNTKLIVGIGNFGENFQYTRHNIGFLIADKFIVNTQFEENASSLYAQVKVSTKTVYVVKPKNNVNNSGIAVKEWKDALNLNCSDILVIYDDIELPFSTIKVKPKGGDGRHGGLKSIINEINCTDFHRIRLGIGSDKRREQLVEYVLGKWTKDEFKELDNLSDRTINIIIDYITFDINTVMNKYN